LFEENVNYLQIICIKPTELKQFLSIRIYQQGFFVTVRAGTRTGTFFEEKKKMLVRYILKE